MQRRLSVRYAFALILIACVLAVTYTTLMRQATLNEKDAHIINISGMQRMLSQRISLLAREIYHAETISQADIYAKKMRDALNKMRENHRQLTRGEFGDGKIRSLSPAMQTLYFSDQGIDKKISEYTNLAEDFLTLYEKSGILAVQDSGLMENIVVIGRNGLLQQLNEAVFQYEHESDHKMAAYKNLETFFFLLGLTILILEALFIFRPMIREIITKTEELETSNAELREFSYRISHDLRAPIMSSLGIVDVARGGVDNDDPDMVKTALGHIKKSMQQLDRLIEDVINLTKMKMIEVPPEAIKLDELIDQVIEKLRFMPEAENLKIERDNALTQPVTTKRLYLQQILENLISNAIKYHDPAKAQSVIQIKAEQRDNHCILIVRDNGLGIPEEYQDQIFKMFKRFHPKVSFGSGLGLYLVLKNAEALGGSLSYKALAEGTEFKVIFPLS